MISVFDLYLDFSFYCHDLRQRYVPRISKNFGSGRLMFWNAFTFKEKLLFCIISPKMNAEKYTELLEEFLIPYLEKSNNTNFQF